LSNTLTKKILQIKI